MKAAHLMLTILILAAAAKPLTAALSQSPEDQLRAEIGAAFKAVAEAEKDGGDVSLLVEDLNQALRLLEAGGVENLREAESKIEAVLVAAPGVAQEGLALTRIKQLKAGVGVTLIAVSAVMVWRFGPRIFWSIWLRSKSGWRVRP